MLKKVLALALPAVAAVGLYLSLSPAEEENAGRGPNRAIEVTTAHVEGRELPRKLALVANLEAWQAVTIASEVSGRLQQISVQSGDRVEQGQVLVKLDNRQQLAQRDEAKASLQEAQRLLSERSRLAKRGAISASELANAEAEVAMAQARLDSAEAELDKRTLRAPFAGSVGLISHAPGAQISAGEELMSLDQLDTLRLDLSVPQRYLAQIQSGQWVNGKVDTYPNQQFAGQLVAIDSRVDSRNMAVASRFAFDNSDGLLKPGMLTRVDLTMPSEQLPIVPVQALEYSGSDRFVYVVDGDNVAHRVQVLVGDRLGNEVTISEGLETGTRIVVQGLVAVRDGAEVNEVMGGGSEVAR
ncbi:efflux RND transporter periplasmic adaptor subunit [Ferrimonas marina]|uniref:RND family efflux transporter, MFP subunit n=1 Tax=Ferrimonas marina TaxID=299255 RepID=A0A1M5REY9_9GAMM|nr:efflux RND transporter periplasmic adaptor subunit [Ferrimonas marina]SHH24680.1 RND family efflux transporter, MFP subunit [Ferrimonas marina]